ncbi:MAG: SCO family protein [Halomonas subglaciescola]|nr:SCO family protein [Halomonas subglaciescola]
MLKWLLPLLAAFTLTLGLAGCSDEHWRTTDIADRMPPLDLSLTDENGQTVDENDYLGKPALVFFGYTHCPDICPVTLARLASVTRQLNEDVRDDLQVLFISVDPARDSPGVLKEYTDAFGPQFIGLTGSKAEIDAVTNRYRVNYRYGDKNESGNYTVTHSSAVLAFDRHGEPSFLTRDTDSDAALISDLAKLLE